MSGIRLHHPTERSCVFVVETAITYPVPYACPLCAKMETRKSIHLRLDAQGDVIVAPPVYEALRLVPEFGGLKVMNDIATPPPLFLGAVAMPTQHIVEHRLNGAQNGAPSYRPGRTQYESRDRMLGKIRIPKLMGYRKGRG